MIDDDARPVPRWAAVLAVAGAAGVLFYIASWAAAGVLIPGFDPLRQAISESFATGVPDGPRRLVQAALLVSGLLTLAAAPAFHRGLPGEGLTGPVLMAISGVFTFAVALAPCSAATCPGAATSAIDRVHTVTAAIGYLTLITAPVAFAVRMRHDRPRFAALSAVMGGLAIVGFTLRYGGVIDALPGLQQRIFNTIADLWYVAAAVAIVRRRRTVPR